ncbi:MAG TPA: hypothetical protein VGF28_13230 [Thermoanaerobaculia bacterium]|jgi:hypothetical protein
MSFRKYNDDISIDPAAEFFVNDTIELRRDPILALEIAASGGVLGVAREYGPLLLTQERAEDLPVVLCDGVGYIAPQNGQKPALLVWTSHPNVSFDDARRILTMTERHSKLGSLTLRYKIDASIDVIAASVHDNDANAVWAAQVFRIRGHDKYEFSRCPVKPQYWPYVLESALADEQDAPGFVAWRLQFIGGVRASYQLPVNDVRLVDVAGAKFEHVACALAIWPPRIIPGWRLYTIASQYILERVDLGFEVWLGNAGEKPVRIAQPDELITSGGILRGLLLSDGSLGPRYLQLTSGDASGYFELLNQELVTQSSLQPVAIDFGTSATTVAHAGRILDLGAGEMARPRVIVRNGPKDLEIDPPWLPTVSAPAYGTVRGLQQIPTGLFTSVADSSVASQLPFIGFTFVSDGFDLDGISRQAHSWTAGLKWTRTDDGISRERERQNFFVSLLTWISAIARASGDTFQIRATYPLAFSRQDILGYGRMLREVMRHVSDLTGAQFQLATPFYATAQADADAPFVDESTPLISGALAPFRHSDAKGAPVVFIADLGGETLDVQLVCLPSERVGEAYRIVACESVRIGANSILEFMESRLLAAPYPPDEAPIVIRTVLNRIIRAGKLPEALRTKSSTQPLVNTRLKWRFDNASTEFLAQIDCYFGLVAEYCARFVAGTLRNRTGLRLRLELAPGPGIVQNAFLDGGELTFSVQPQLIGNGWKMLELLLGAAGTDTTDPMSWLLKKFYPRVQALLVPEQLEIPLHSPASTVLKEKTETARGTLSLGTAEPRHTQATLVIAAPNGFDDEVKGQKYAWSTLVGAGGESVPDIMQNELLVSPPLPDAGVLTITNGGASRFRALFSNTEVPKRHEHKTAVRTLQDREDTKNLQDRREISSARATWERVIRPQLLA